MKRFAALALSVILLLSCLGLAAAEESALVQYASDFSEGTDGWYARSAGGAEITVTDESALLITGRSASWNSPGRDFPLTVNHIYDLSVEIRQNAKETVTFIVSVAHTKYGIESYENLIIAPVAQNEWVKLEGTYIPGDYDAYVLYVETQGDGLIDFEIRSFTCVDQAALTEDGVEDEESALPSLKEVYADYFDFGTAITRSEAANRDRMAFCATQFSIVTAGNEMKPDALIDLTRSRQASAEDPTAVVLSFTAPTPVLNWAKANGVKVHGHVFVWHSQTPEAFFHENYNTAEPYVSREVMLGRLENFIRQTFEWLEENYPGLVVSYDVCNEVIDDSTGQLRASNWLTVVGDDYVARAFEIARRYAPEGVKLYYNDYNTAYTGKLLGIRRLLVSLQEEGNIDGYGFQMHHALNSPSLAMIRSAVQSIASLGLRMRISELDITVSDATDYNFREQAVMYRGIMDIILPYADQIDAVQVWGVTDNMSWRSYGYPLLFNSALQPKPAFWALVNPDYLSEE